jgi:hypothetical protein
MHVFIDESGNTGANILDRNQPFLLTGALITKGNLDQTYELAWSKLLAKYGLTDLHAEKAGVEIINLLAPSLIKILKSSGSRTAFYRVEKRYALAAIIHQTLFDPQENKGVSSLHAHAPPLKLGLVLALGQVLTDNVASLFVDCLLHEKREEKAQEKLITACSCLKIALQSSPDPRARDIWMNAANLAERNQKNFVIKVGDKAIDWGRHPNTIAFINLLQLVDKLFVAWKPKICVIKHDRQKKYKSTLEFWQNLAKTARQDAYITQFGEAMKFGALPTSQIDFVEATMSVGVQLVDTCLWVLNRGFQQKTLGSETTLLLEHLLRRSSFGDFSFEGASEMFRKFMNS